ncbi:hypothetical protein SAMN05421503_1496 [Terribacillus aidingensis]|uniref:Group-specific protein n=1 Tax=Terribacillus aidingensis TaxID=586416 RepID=A0A285NQZ9_9BACI|nr:group-specific protein [Terribacillus aidingensis]SNZ10041.1 hypothetical protein SAMN05421503_1496 [Terribacillus aidingensis]
MFQVKINEDELKAIYLETLQQHIEEIDKECIFWDSKELMKQTKMSWNTIQDKFFYDSRFPKKKIGGKWYYHGEKTKQFLSYWFAEQD